ncbi:MAG: DciA family protein, partial [Planctomycetota bacterium]
MPVLGNPAPRRHNRKAVLIGDLVGKVLRSRGLSAPAQHQAVFSAWEKIVPHMISSRCRPISFR